MEIVQMWAKSTEFRRFCGDFHFRRFSIESDGPGGNFGIWFVFLHSGGQNGVCELIRKFVFFEYVGVGKMHFPHNYRGFFAGNRPNIDEADGISSILW